MNKSKVFRKEAKRYGWIDFSLHVIFSIIMIISFYVAFFVFPPESMIDFILALLAIVIPLAFFGYRTIVDALYHKDYMEIIDKTLKYRSTSLITTGYYRIKKGEIALREIRKFGMATIPHKLSIDLWRQKNLAMFVILLRNGKELFLGEYISNQDLAETALYIRKVYPKVNFVTKINLEYPDLDIEVDEEKIKTAEIEEDESYIEGVTFR